MPQMVRVRLNAKQVVRYSVVKEIPLEEFEEYRRRCEADGRPDEQWFTDLAERHIDPLSHEQDADDYEDVELYRLGRDGKVMMEQG